MARARLDPEVVITSMVNRPAVVWWFDEDTSTWHAQDKVSGVSRTSTYGRDEALIFLYRAMQDRKGMTAYYAAITQTGA